MFTPEYRKKEKQNYCSNLRLVISGTCFEFYEFSHEIMYGSRRRKIKEELEKGEIEIVRVENKLSEEEAILSSARRAKRGLRRIIKANAWKWFDVDERAYLPITLTLTFADEIRDIEKANSMFSDFIQRLNYSVNLIERGYGKKEAKKNLLKYSSVIEFQDETRGGVVHYHIIFYNLPRMEKIYDRLTSIWGKGYFWVGTKSKKRRGKNFSSINASERLNKVVEYFTKYVTKSFKDERLRNKKKYFNSRELLKPIAIEVEELVHTMLNNMPAEALDYSAEDLKYKYKLSERSFNYKRFDLDKFPEKMKEAMDLVRIY